MKENFLFFSYLISLIPSLFTIIYCYSSILISYSTVDFLVYFFHYLCIVLCKLCFSLMFNSIYIEYCREEIVWVSKMKRVAFRVMLWHPLMGHQFLLFFTMQHLSIFSYCCVFWYLSACYLFTQGIFLKSKSLCEFKFYF